MKIRSLLRQSKDKTIESVIVDGISKNYLLPFTDWLEGRRDKLYKIGWSFLGNSHDVEDALHNTIIKVIENIQQLKEKRYFETWVIAIYINECRSLLRIRKKEEIKNSFDDIQVTSIEGSLMELEYYLNTLDENNREVIILKYISGYSQEEIAEILQIPIGTVKSRIYRGLQALRKSISEEV